MKGHLRHTFLRRVAAVAALFSISTGVLSGQIQNAPPVELRGGMVASEHELASRVGVEIMKQGGNAVDAAIAVGLALAVVYPEAGNLGGGGFMLYRKSDGSAFAIDYREAAPAAAGRDIFVGPDGELKKGEGSSTIGYRAAGVPGTLAGFELAYKKYGSGKVAWRELVEPARLLAQNGYKLSKRLADLLVDNKKDLSKYDDSRRIFLRNGNFYQPGELFRQPDLAATLGRIAKNGAREFYEGRTARLIARDMKKNNGLITLGDLKNYRAKDRTPLRGSYRGFGIIAMPPPSSGGLVLLESLNILEGYDLKAIATDSAQKYHLLIETMRRSFADRAEYMGDPDFSDVPAARLIDKKYAAARRATIGAARASRSTDIKAGNVAVGEGSDTTNFTVVDGAGNMVVNTYTINDLYGSKVTAAGTGVLLNDEMDDFAARPGRPNMFGLIQGERNAVQGGKRPLSSMTPTIVLRKDGTVWFGVGARGGPRIISAVLQTVVNVIDYGMNLQDAIDAPRVHQQWLPDEVVFEPTGFSADTLSRLESYGHRFAQKRSTVASATGIMITDDGRRLGAIDRRSDGKAEGY